MERSDADVDDFLASVDEAEAMQDLDRLIASEMEGLERVLWEGPMWGGTDQRIVGYGAIEQPRPKGEPIKWFLVGLARQKAHFSVYVNAAVSRDPAELGDVKIASAAITFRKVGDLKVDGFRAMLRQARSLTPDAT